MNGVEELPSRHGLPELSAWEIPVEGEETWFQINMMLTIEIILRDNTIEEKNHEFNQDHAHGHDITEFALPPSFLVTGGTCFVTYFRLISTKNENSKS